MNKDIEQIVVRFGEHNRVVFKNETTNEIMSEIDNMEDVDVVSIQFKDNEVVNFTSGIMSCDMGEIHKGVSTPNIHMSSCLTKKEAIKEIKELIGGTT